MSNINYLYHKISDDPKCTKYSQVISKLSKYANETTSHWSSRIENKILHLNKLEKDENTNNIPLDYNLRRPCSKFSGISNTSAKKAKLLTISNEIPYNIALELNKLWMEYAKDVLCQNDNHQQSCKSLAMCDLQGAMVKVVESSSPTYNGITGIIIRETKHGFNIVTTSNSVKFVLKQNSIFMLKYNDWTFYIHGNHMIYTPAQRSKRKNKIKSTL